MAKDLNAGTPDLKFNETDVRQKVDTYVAGLSLKISSVADSEAEGSNLKVILAAKLPNNGGNKTANLPFASEEEAQFAHKYLCELRGGGAHIGFEEQRANTKLLRERLTIDL